MRKLILTCECGQRMQVPRSAIGKMGLCPNCGRTIPVAASNTSPVPVKERETERRLSFGLKTSWWRGAGAAPSEEAKQKFGQAADLFYAGRYGEALAIFDALAKQFPNDPDIEKGREHCLRAMRQGPLALPKPGAPARVEGKLDAETVKRIVLDKMLRGATDDVQLKAAEIAARIIGLHEDGRVTKPVAERLSGMGEVAAKKDDSGSVGSAGEVNDAAAGGTSDKNVVVPSETGIGGDSAEPGGASGPDEQHVQ